MRTARIIFIGNYALGVNAILPTGCVTVFDFLKRSSIGYMSKQGYDSLKDVAMQFADYEGFPAHANAVRKR